MTDRLIGTGWSSSSEEVEPVGNALNDNLFEVLLLSTTLVPADLDVLDL